MRLTSRIFYAWLPFLSVSLAIIAGSGPWLGSSNTMSFFTWIVVHLLKIEVGPDSLLIVNAVGRKVGHFLTYMTLGALAFRAWRALYPAAAAWTLRWALLSLVSVFVTASLDELHQSLYPSRTGTFHDVILDLSGALMGQLLLAAAVGFLRNGEAEPH
jgi:VanZ family protein